MIRPHCPRCKYLSTCSDENKAIQRENEAVGLPGACFHEDDIPHLSEAGDA